MWTYMMAAARGDRAMSSISQRHQSNRNDFDSPSIYHFNRVQRPLYNTTHRAPGGLCNGPLSTITGTGSPANLFGSNTIYQNQTVASSPMGGSFSSVATTPSLSCPMGSGGSGPGPGPGTQPVPSSAPPALSSSPFQGGGVHPAFTTRNRPEVAEQQQRNQQQQQNQQQSAANQQQLSMPNSTGKNNHLSQAVIESERSDLLFHRGSPLICKTGEIFQTVALLSDTSQCMDQNVTEMFTSAVEYSTWISSIVSENWSMQQTNQEQSWRLSKFNWLTLAILFFIASVIIFIKVLRSGFKI